MVLRPDEEANQAEIQRDRDFRSNVGSSLKSGAKALGAAAVGGAAYASPLASRIMPFLSQYVPSEMSVKGISKISPMVGDFLKRGQNMGLPIEEGLDYLRSQFSEKAPPKESRSIIEQYDPELQKYISENLKKGMSLVEAGQKALKHERFSKVIKDLIRDHKASWSSILSTVFGGGQQQPEQQMQPPEQQAQAPQQAPQQAAQQQGAGRQRLAAARQRGQQALGG